MTLIFFVEADRYRITQVISNLLNNAIKFTKEEGAVSVTLEKKKEDNQQEVLVSVKDSGTGIHSDILPRLFSKFATKAEKGTGLGLFISKSIIEAHGGRIWGENNIDGKGLDSVSLFRYLTSTNRQNKIKQLKSCHNLLI